MSNSRPATPINRLASASNVARTDLVPIWSSVNSATRKVTWERIISDLGLLTNTGTGPNIINLNNNATLTIQQVQDTDIVFCDSTSTAFTVQLPSYTALPIGTAISFKKSTAVDNDVTILAEAAETIDGDASLVLSGTTLPSAQLVYNGVAWFVFSA